MLTRLLESKANKQRNTGSTVFSIVLHSTIIAAAVWTTAHAATANDPPKPETLTYIKVDRNEPPPAQPRDAPAPARTTTSSAPAPKAFQQFTAPIDVPNVIPDIDLTAHAIDLGDFANKGIANGPGADAGGGAKNGISGGSGTGTDNGAYWIGAVEKPAMMDQERSPSPRYPNALESSGIEGVVRAQFVVDTTGRAETGSLKILSATHELFAAAVRANLPRMRFFPAEVGGQKVRQIVEQQFTFKKND